MCCNCVNRREFMAITSASVVGIDFAGRFMDIGSDGGDLLYPFLVAKNEKQHLRFGSWGL